MIRVVVPASSANLGSGTDCLGVALPIYLQATFEEADQLTFTFEGSTQNVPLEQNLIYVAARKLFRSAGTEVPPMKVAVKSDIPLARGLGSSASAIVAGIWGANAWLGNPFSQQELVTAAVEIEGHPDNVVPCVAGGFTVAMPTQDTVLFSKISVNKKLYFTVAVPEYELPTKRAREVLPVQVDLKNSLQQIQRACYLVSAFNNSVFDSLYEATQDLMFTPYRRDLIPGFDDVVGSAVSAGAKCAVISGAGPTILAMSTTKKAATDAAKAMQKSFEKTNIYCETHILNADNDGVQVMTKKGIEK